ncbi:uncharacterized protein LOC128385947 [Panonychus citri]|uniref:uncharacterized protein LOC128385947 n=1 Tax=Panonychus citri TaxID=50023 RepID=UPI0023071124|nr:uncharacterized protein LOC128385947 [Panonychus citri]
MKSIEFAILVTAFILIVSNCHSLREIDFLNDLKPHYGQDLINRLFADQIDRRIKNIVRLGGQANLTTDQTMFASITVFSLEMIKDLVNQSNNQILPSIDNELFTYLTLEYDSIVSRFYSELTNYLNDDLNVDQLMPKTLIHRLHPLINITTFETIKSQGLSLIDSYKSDIIFMGQDQLIAGNKTMVSFAIDQLDWLRYTMRRVESGKSNFDLSVYSLKQLIKQFDMILSLIVGKPYKLH